MTVYVCSLSATPDQIIPPGGGYTLLKFPFTEEQFDEWGMHEAHQPDGVTAKSTETRSGLIWPCIAGWGALTANFIWEAGNYNEIRDQFVRDPLGLAGPPDYTAVDHRPPSPGQQFFTKHHEIFVNPETPLGVMVRHDDSVPRRVTYAQLKVAIHPT
ncbi:hypothetical protein [Streptomyces sp900116325]|uniref:hypothetical protein n=1 Tax=Streptomyces sp. 900116325 TaxID=3154295 RepID=UPI0033E55A93